MVFTSPLGEKSVEQLNKVFSASLGENESNDLVMKQLAGVEERLAMLE